MPKKIKSQISKVKFELGWDPVIDSRNNFLEYIPTPCHSVFILSADFELAWAWQFAKVLNPYEQAIQKARQARRNIPMILELCNFYNVPITWATVGHLFLEECKCQESNAHNNLPQLSPFEGEFIKYEGNNWFQNDPCSNYKDRPIWYAPDLIYQIIKADPQHEIGCHTFSHIDCRDNICLPEVFRAEIGECKKLAEEWGIKLESFVHPAHTIGHLDDLANLGFTNYRTNNRNVLGFPIKHRNGLWEFEQTTELAYRKDWSLKYHIYRYKKIIERALNSNTLCYFWFHPSVDPLFVEEVFPEIFRFLDDHREDIWITTSGKYIRFLNETK